MRKIIIPNEHTIYGPDDEVLVEYMQGRREEMLKVARDVATKRQACVFVYGNGREAVEPAPSVGCPATVCYWTDRHAATVVAVSPSGHKVTVREDKAIRTDKNGMSEEQSYRYEPDPEGREHTFFRNAKGTYGRRGGTRLALGMRGSYHDYSF